MRLEVKDIVLSDSLDITFHLYQTKCLLTSPLQNEVIETQQAKAPAVILNHNVACIPSKASSSPTPLAHLHPLRLSWRPCPSTDLSSVVSTLDIFAEQNLYLQSHDFKEGGKRNYRVQRSVNDASGMSNAGCYTRQSVSSSLPNLSQFSSITMFLANKATWVWSTFGIHRE